MTPRVALVPWGDAIEDFLEPLGLDLAGFRDEMAGGWLFGYVEALQAAQINTTIVCCSREVRAVARWRHGPTGAEMLVLPVPEVALRWRATLADPLAWTARQAGPRRSWLGALSAQPAHQLSPYLVTPLGLLAREARRGGWRAIVCQEYEYQRSDLCALLARVRGIPAFATFQGGSETRTGLERLIRPRLIRAWTGLIVASRAESERVQRRYGIPAGRIAEVPNPLAVPPPPRSPRAAVRRELEIPQDALLAIWHGRVDIPVKGLDLLLDAWASLEDDDTLPDRRLLLVGGGRDADLLRARLAEMENGACGAVGRVIWIDRYVLDPVRLAELLGAADLYVFPSRREGFAVAPLEAMAAGLPVVAAAASGVNDLFPEGRGSGGVIVPVGDALALARAVAELLTDPAEREHLAANARRRAAAAYSPQAIGSRLRQVILPGS